MNLSDIATEKISDAQEDLGTYEQMEANLIPNMSDGDDGIEVCKLAAEYSRFADKISHATESIKVAKGMLLSLESINPKVGMKSGEARVIMAAVEGMRVHLGHTRGSKKALSAESIGAGMDDASHLRMAKEGIVSFIKDVIKAIIDAIINAGKWIYGFISRLFGRDKSSSGKSENLKKNIENLEKRSDRVDPRTGKMSREAIDKLDAIKAGGGSQAEQLEKVVKVTIEEAIHQSESKMGRKLTDEEKREIEQLMRRTMGVGPGASQASTSSANSTSPKSSTSTTSVKIYKKAPNRSTVPNLQMNGHGYKDVTELLKWITDFETVHINTYEKAIQKSNLDAIVGDLKDYIANIDNDYARQNSIVKVFELTFKPLEKELQSAKAENDIKYAEGPETVGGYATVGLCPDILLGGHRVEQHLGGSLLSVKKVQQEVLVDADKPVPGIELDFAKRILVGVEGLQKRMLVSHLMPFKKVQDELTHSAQELQKKFENDEDLTHLGHLAVTAVHAFTATYINYVTTTQAYSTKIINELLLVVAVSANKERVALQMAEGLEDFIKQFNS